MESINLESYYDRISDIRARVMSKQKDNSKDIIGKYSNQNTTHIRKTSNYGDSSSYNSRGRSYREREGYDQRQPLEGRRPLEIKKEREANVARQEQQPEKSNIVNRVKQLESVNDRIKMVLANKRESSVSNINPKTSSNRKNDNHEHLTPKRMTSLFQNEKAIVESKVGVSAWPTSKEKRAYEQECVRPTKRDPLTFKLEMPKEVLKKQDFESARREKDGESKRKFNTPIQQLYKGQETERQTKVTLEEFSFELDIDYKPSREQLIKKLDKEGEPVGYGKGESKKLIAMLVKQIQLDVKLRESKEKFDYYKEQKKWNMLKDKIGTYGVHLLKEEIESWIKISNEECDPFIQFSQQKTFDFDELAVRFVAAWQFWTNQMRQCVTIEGLEQEGFNIRQIDIGHKGYITIQDLVCFINMNSDSFFRNRDVCQMFRRWNKLPANSKLQNKMKYQTFLSCVSR